MMNMTLDQLNACSFFSNEKLHKLNIDVCTIVYMSYKGDRRFADLNKLLTNMNRINYVQ